MYEVSVKLLGAWHRYCKTETREEAVEKMYELMSKDLGSAVKLEKVKAEEES